MIFFFFSSRRRHTRLQGDWSSDVCSSDLTRRRPGGPRGAGGTRGGGPSGPRPGCYAYSQFVQKAHRLIRRRSRACRNARHFAHRSGGRPARLDIFPKGPACLDLHASAQHRAVFNREAFRAQVPGNIRRTPQLNLLAPYDFSIDAPAHDDFSREDVRFDFAVGTNGDAAGVAQVEFPFDVAVHEQIFAAAHFALDPNSLANARRRVRGKGSCCIGFRITDGSCARRVPSRCGIIRGWLGLNFFFLPHGDTSTKIFSFSKSLFVGWLGVRPRNREHITALTFCKAQYLAAISICALTGYTTHCEFRSYTPTIGCAPLITSLHSARAIPTSPRPFRPLRAQTLSSKRAFPTSAPARNRHRARRLLGSWCPPEKHARKYNALAVFGNSKSPELCCAICARPRIARASPLLPSCCSPRAPLARFFPSERPARRDRAPSTLPHPRKHATSVRSPPPPAPFPRDTLEPLAWRGRHKNCRRLEPR